MNRLGAAGIVTPLTPVFLYLNAAIFSKGAVGASTPAKERIVRRVLRQRLRHHDGLSLELRRIVRNVYFIRSKLYKESGLPWDYQFEDGNEDSTEFMDPCSDTLVEWEAAVELQEAQEKRRSQTKRGSHEADWHAEQERDEREDERHESLQLRLGSLIGRLNSEADGRGLPGDTEVESRSCPIAQHTRPWSARPRTLNALLQRTWIAPMADGLVACNVCNTPILGLDESEVSARFLSPTEMPAFRPPLPAPFLGSNLENNPLHAQPEENEHQSSANPLVPSAAASCQGWTCRSSLPYASAVLRSKNARSFAVLTRSSQRSSPVVLFQVGVEKVDKAQAEQSRKGLTESQFELFGEGTDGRAESEIAELPAYPASSPPEEAERSVGNERSEKNLSNSSCRSALNELSILKKTVASQVCSRRRRPQLDGKLKLPRRPDRAHPSGSRPQSANLPQWIAKRRIRIDSIDQKGLWPHDVGEKLKRTLLNASAADL